MQNSKILKEKWRMKLSKSKFQDVIKGNTVMKCRRRCYRNKKDLELQ